MIEIYTDGSHLNKQNGGRLGIGGVLIKDKTILIDEFSEELTPEFMKSEFNADTCSNPSAELVAVLIALMKFKKEISKADSVLLYSDYIGVKEWLSGNWKIKESYISNIKTSIDKEISNQGLNGKLKFEWVKGHQKSDSIKAYWNNYVDKLAKGIKQ